MIELLLVSAMMTAAGDAASEQAPAREDARAGFTATAIEAAGPIVSAPSAVENAKNAPQAPVVFDLGTAEPLRATIGPDGELIIEHGPAETVEKNETEAPQ